MCFKKKAPDPVVVQQQQAAQETAAAVADEKAAVIEDVRAAKTEDIQAEAPLTEREIKMGKRGGTGRRTLLVSGAGGAGYLDRFAGAIKSGSRLWG